MKALVTGGSGFIGSRLAMSLRARGAEVVAFGQQNGPAESANAAELEGCGVKVALGSVTRPADLAAVVPGVDVVFHLAAAQHEANVADSLFHEVNVEGTRNVIDASLRAGVRRLVHGSTIGVYRAEPASVVDERAPLQPLNVYGRTKLEAERLVQALDRRLPWVVVRISETFGPGDRRLLKLFRGVAKGRFPLIGPGLNLHHPIYIDDLVECLVRAAESPAAVEQTFVAAGPEVVTSRNMIEETARALGVRARIIRLPLKPLWMLARALEWTMTPLGLQPPIHRRRLNFFILGFHFQENRTRLLLDYEPATRFSPGIRNTLQWYREQNLLAP